MLWKKQTRKSAVHPAIIIICENQAKDKASAHAYANSKIVSELDSRLHINICNESGGHEQVIRDSAAGMLLDDSKSRHGQTKSSPVLSPADD